MAISEDEINAKRTANGGYTKSQLAEWGVPWPPPKGWKARLIMGEPGQQERVLSGYNLHRVHETKDMFDSSCSYCKDRNNKLPHPFKCSKCNYIAVDKADFNEHWSLEH